ncbi:hypothetical protein ACUY4R_001148 [Kosakonia sp. BK9b]
MDTLSYIMPKLAWIIPLVIVVFVGIAALKNKSNRKDK